MLGPPIPQCRSERQDFGFSVCVCVWVAIFGELTWLLSRVLDLSFKYFFFLLKTESGYVVEADLGFLDLSAPSPSDSLGVYIAMPTISIFIWGNQSHVTARALCLSGTPLLLRVSH